MINEGPAGVYLDVHVQLGARRSVWQTVMATPSKIAVAAFLDDLDQAWQRR